MATIFDQWVRDINPNAFITGEVWWEDFWNNKQFDASPWLVPGRFDAVMNYRFGDAMFNFFCRIKHLENVCHQIYAKVEYLRIYNENRKNTNK